MVSLRNSPLLLTVGFASLLRVCLLPGGLGAAPHLVENGVAKSEIVIPESPSRSTRLAAADLQHYVRKISGARLPIVFAPSANVPVQVYVGDSPHTRQLGLRIDDLEGGAYRIASGGNWLALIGDDSDFVPTEPWARNNSDRTSGKLQSEWEARAGYSWGVPNGGMYKHRQRMPNDIGLPDGVEPESEQPLEIWNFDERGSYNAVCGFLRTLGVRWYLPGELGEVIPEMDSIPLPEIDRTVQPDFPVRQFNVRWSTASDETMYWMMRLGIRQPYGLMIAHGMHTMTHTDEILQKHPDWFALYGGKRDNTPGERLNHLCYSNKELFDHTVRWAQAQFDIYDYATVSIMPPDAYIAICQCDLCEGKEVPEMGSRGKLSNHVWDFVNRVAIEVGKTHPNKKILCCAYGANTNPPTNITKLEPNVQVMIVGGRRPRNTLPEQREEIRKLRAGWLTKTDNPLMVFENYPFTDRGWYLPAFTARAIGNSINATKDTSSGEDIWLSLSRDFDTEKIGFNHFQVYFTARMYWGGKEQDSAAMLDTYCRDFYGPAAAEMKAFFEYCEPNWQAMETDVAPVTEALQLFVAAKSKVDAESIYGKRIALIDEFLEDLRSKSELLSQKRGPVSKLRTVWEPREPIVIDGKLDEDYWENIPASSTGRLRELQTGRTPTFGTRVMAAWDRSGSNLYLAIRCDENPGEELNIATRENEDPSIWYGDAVEILLDTDAHRYYQIAVNPAGALVDLDRGADRDSWYRWESQAEVATQISEDHWTVEIRIPVTEDENDPLNQVVGRKPSRSLPWHFNLCRQRIRDNGTEWSAFSPTGTPGFHKPMKFAHFYDGRSHAFDVDPGVSDYLIENGKAEALQRRRKLDDAIEAWVLLSRREDLTDFQKSDALARATSIARQKKDKEKADELTAKIPIEAIRKTSGMENLLAARKWDELLEQFGSEDLASWPFWQAGAGAFARGRAAYAAKEGELAERDFLFALPFISDPRTRLSLLRSIAHNRELVLGDDAGALEFYRRVISGKGGGGADFYYGLQGASRILTKQQKHDEAIAVFDVVNLEKTQGSWKSSLHLSRAEAFAAAGKTSEARKDLETVIQDPKIQASVKAKAEALLADLSE